MLRLSLQIGLVYFVCASSFASDAVDFNWHVRPILNAHCVSCHGGVKQAGDLSLVYPDQVLAAIEPGDAEASVLWERVTADDPDERMPPAEHGRALNMKELATLKRWIDGGAKLQGHWAFEAPQKHDLAPLPKDAWGGTRVDAFVYKRLIESDLSPTEPAAPDRWLRRVSLDLVGLPPTPAEREDFLADLEKSDSQAYRRAVDRLLRSKHFGERWASVWLDAIRYADSQGLGQDFRRSVWKFRDWVIRSLNADMPYDQFTIMQLAGDLLPSPTIDNLLATTSCRLTQTNVEGGTDDEEFRVEAVIDRVNTVWQAWQGVTFGCVQCHSHPYEPIPHDEYYKFAAFFNNTADCDLGSDLPQLAVPLDHRNEQRARTLDQKIAELQHADWKLANEIATDESAWTSLTGLKASTNNKTVVKTAQIDGFEEYQTVGTVAGYTTVTIEGAAPASMRRLTALKFTGLPKNLERAEKDSEWGFVVSLVEAHRVSSQGKSEAIPVKRVIADEPKPLLNPQSSLNAENSDGFGAYSRIHYPRYGVCVFENTVSLQPGDRLRISLRFNKLELGAFPLVAHRGRFAVSDSERFTTWLTDKNRVAARQQIVKLKSERDKIQSVTVPIMQRRPGHLLRPSHVFDRGSYLSKTDRVGAATPKFLGNASHSKTEEPTRLDMARWIASSDNPLTARVAVNRVWGQLFGVGLVESQEDFGSTGTLPSHPELLDDLAVRFQTEMKWSLKELIRELVLSSTYRQSTRTSTDKLKLDPRNRLLSRGPQQRLPAETIRDQALAIGGLLSKQQFGPPVHPPIPDGVWKPFQGSDKWSTPNRDHPDRYRRTIYTYTKRSIPFPVMATFDAPSREFCSMRRLPSNTPLQALATLNDANFVEAAQGLARRMAEVSQQTSDRLTMGFLLATCREPTQAELESIETLYQRILPQGEDQALFAVSSVLLNLDEVLTK